MDSIVFVFLSLIVLVIVFFNKNLNITSVFTWQTKYIGISIVFIGAFSFVFFDLFGFDSNYEDVFRYALTILGLVLVLLSKDKVDNNSTSTKKSEIFILSFLSCVLASLVVPFLGVIEFSVSVPKFIISVLFLYVVVYHSLILINKIYRKP